MNQDLEQLLKAIQITEQKYGEGTVKWMDYLNSGDVTCFTSSNGARQMVSSLNYQELQRKVCAKALYQLYNYLCNHHVSSKNKVVNHLVLWLQDACFDYKKIGSSELEDLFERFSKKFLSLNEKFHEKDIFAVWARNFLENEYGDDLKISKKFLSILRGLASIYEPALKEEEIKKQEKAKPEVTDTIDGDVRTFLQAINVTENKYDSGKVSFTDYLSNGNSKIFTTSLNVRGMIEELDWQTVRLKVFIQTFQNILQYFEEQKTFRLPKNQVAVHLIDRINWEFEMSDDTSDIFWEAVDNFLSNASISNENLEMAFDMISGKISPDRSKVVNTDEYQNIRDYLERLIDCGKTLLDHNFKINNTTDLKKVIDETVVS